MPSLPPPFSAHCFSISFPHRWLALPIRLPPAWAQRLVRVTFLFFAWQPPLPLTYAVKTQYDPPLHESVSM